MKKRLDSLEGMHESDLVQTAKDLLDAAIKSTSILELQEMTPQKLQEAKLVLGFLNATNNLMQTKLNVFKMTGLSEKVAAVKNRYPSPDDAE